MTSKSRLKAVQRDVAKLAPEDDEPLVVICNYTDEHGNVVEEAWRMTVPAGTWRNVVDTTINLKWGDEDEQRKSN